MEVCAQLEKNGMPQRAHFLERTELREKNGFKVIKCHLKTEQKRVILKNNYLLIHITCFSVYGNDAVNKLFFNAR